MDAGRKRKGQSTRGTPVCERECMMRVCVSVCTQPFATRRWKSSGTAKRGRDRDEGGLKISTVSFFFQFLSSFFVCVSHSLSLSYTIHTHIHIHTDSLFCCVLFCLCLLSRSVILRLWRPFDFQFGSRSPSSPLPPTALPDR